MNLDVIKQGDQYVIVPLGGSPIKFSSAEEVVQYLTDNATQTHPQAESPPSTHESKLEQPKVDHPGHLGPKPKTVAKSESPK